MQRLRWLTSIVATVAVAGCASASSDTKGAGSSDAAATTTAKTSARTGAPALGAEVVLQTDSAVAQIEELANGNLLLVWSDGSILGELDRNLQPIPFKTATAPPEGAVYLVDDGASLLYVGPSQMAKFSSSTGAAVSAFGNGGTIDIPITPGDVPASGGYPENIMSGQGSDGTVAVVLDEIPDPSGNPYQNAGAPNDIAIAVVESTGALTQKVALTLPDEAGVDAFVPLHDGNFALVISSIDNPSTAPYTHFSLIRTSNGQALPPIDLFAGPGASEDPIDSIHELADGSVSLFLTGLPIDTPSAISGQVFEATLAPGAATPTLHTFGAIPSVSIPSLEMQCGTDSAQASDAVWMARSIIEDNHYSAVEVSKAPAAGGAPQVVDLPLPNRCVMSVVTTPSGLVFVDALDVTNGGTTSYLTRID